jgi:hypothetical protein
MNARQPAGPLTYVPHPRQLKFLESERLWRLRGGSTLRFVEVDGQPFVGLGIDAMLIDAPDPRAGWRRRRRVRRARRRWHLRSVRQRHQAPLWILDAVVRFYED